MNEDSGLNSITFFKTMFKKFDSEPKQWWQLVFFVWVKTNNDSGWNHVVKFFSVQNWRCVCKKFIRLKKSVWGSKGKFEITATSWTLICDSGCVDCTFDCATESSTWPFRIIVMLCCINCEQWHVWFVDISCLEREAKCGSGGGVNGVGDRRYNVCMFLASAPQRPTSARCFLLSLSGGGAAA